MELVPIAGPRHDGGDCDHGNRRGVDALCVELRRRSRADSWDAGGVAGLATASFAHSRVHGNAVVAFAPTLEPSRCGIRGEGDTPSPTTMDLGVRYRRDDWRRRVLMDLSARVHAA